MPLFSVILPGPAGCETVLAALDAWAMQPHRDCFEVLVTCRHAPPRGITLPCDPVIVVTGEADLHEARARAIRQARGEYIVLAEDHCLPDANWTPAIMARLREGWDAVGCALRPGTHNNAWAEASFLIGYGEWMLPFASGPAEVLCGWNVVIRRQLLVERRDTLANDLRFGTTLLHSLRRGGARLFLEGACCMRHFDPGSRARLTRTILNVGLSLGGIRTSQWPAVARFLYPLAWPLVSLLHAKRAFQQYVRAGRASGLSMHVLAVSFLFAAVWGVGEAAGAWMGERRVTPLLAATQIKPPARDVV